MGELLRQIRQGTGNDPPGRIADNMERMSNRKALDEIVIGRFPKISSEMDD
ncbi:hypothetical protein MTR72_15865 [Bradyrhizobium sp. ISRA442]|uniref:hypothetical protein n=1 Tax=Bradyrhizobium sp. ISRA442 TaxID=2866197 RepID=UPI00311AD474